MDVDKDTNTVADIGELVITLEKIDAYLVFLLLTAGAVWLEHMAFRTPAWQRREFVRRAIGIETVLLLFLLVVWLGDADMTTWVMVQGGFLVAGGVKAATAYLDSLRSRSLLGKVSHDANAAQDS
jgi:hypothetical protein